MSGTPPTLLARLTPRQLIVLQLLADESKPMQVPDDLCSSASMASLERRGIVRSTRSGYRITKQGKEMMNHGLA